jgi:hypothetical protein
MQQNIIQFYLNTSKFSAKILLSLNYIINIQCLFRCHITPISSSLFRVRCSGVRLKIGLPSDSSFYKNNVPFLDRKLVVGPHKKSSRMSSIRKNKPFT